MKEDKRVSEKDIAEAAVRLKPIFGVKPETYLPILYGFAALALLFAILVLPGLRKNGTVIRFESDPPGAAVYVDGVYRGATPCEIFVPRGERVLGLAYPGFEPSDRATRVGGRLFASLFFPRRDNMAVSLKPSLPADAILDSGMRGFASWALSGQPSDAYQIPMVLSDAARAYTRAAFNPDGSFAGPAEAGFAAAALSYSTHAVSARDALRAAAMVQTSSAALSPLGLGKLLEALAASPEILRALAPRLDADERSALEATGLYQANAAEPALPAPRVSGGGRYAGHDFLLVKGDSQGDAAIDDFYLARQEVSVGHFRAFLAQNPDWADAKALQALGQADENYLSGLQGAADGESMRWVTRHAAQAYCDWLNETQKAPAGYRFCLPSEAQWARAAAASASLGDMRRYAVLMESGRSGPGLADAMPVDGAGFQGLLGGLWEWTADSYSHFPSLGEDGRLNYPSPEAAVRGGSWANAPGSVDLSSRGPVPESSSSAYLGFRLAMAKRD